MVDVEKIVIDWVIDKLNDTSVLVADTIPNPRPTDKMVIVEATGGSSSFSENIDETMIAMQFYAPTRAQAYTLARQVHEIMPDLADEFTNEVAYISQGVPYNWTDREPRYQTMITIKTVD